MADGFTVSAGVLLSGSGELGRLRDDVDQAGSAAIAALMGAADACGSGQVQAAVNVFAATAMRRFLDAMAGCEVTEVRLAQTARGYLQVESENARQVAEAMNP